MMQSFWNALVLLGAGAMALCGLWGAAAVVQEIRWRRRRARYLAQEKRLWTQAVKLSDPRSRVYMAPGWVALPDVQPRAINPGKVQARLIVLREHRVGQEAASYTNGCGPKGA